MDLHLHLQLHPRIHWDPEPPMDLRMELPKLEAAAQ